MKLVAFNKENRPQRPQKTAKYFASFKVLSGLIKQQLILQ